MRQAVFVVLGAVVVSVPFSRGQNPSQDPVKLSPQYYKVRLENDRVRVLEIVSSPERRRSCILTRHTSYIF